MTPCLIQALPRDTEGFLLNIIREEFGPLLDGTDLSLLAVVGSHGIGRVTLTPVGGEPMAIAEAVNIDTLLKADNTAEHFTSLVRRYAQASVSGVVPKFIAPGDLSAVNTQEMELGKPTLRTSRHCLLRKCESNYNNSAGIYCSTI